MDRTCAGCGASMMLYRADAKACSARCRKRISRKAATDPIPDRLRSADRWMRRTRTKRPVTTTGTPASSAKPATWSSYAAAKSSSAGVGLGFALGDGIGCYDLDAALVGGRLTDWAREFIESIPEPVIFTEVSQSGHGVHVFIEADEGPGRVIRDGRNIERYTTGRYIAVTGVPFTS